MSFTVDTEIRKLDLGVISELAQYLTSNNDWQTLMSAVTIPETNSPRFSRADTELVEEAARQQQRLPAEIFLNEWSTMGRKRPTVGLIIELLVQRGLFRAADYLAVDVLKEAPPPRPQTGAGANIDVSGMLSELDSGSDDDTDKQKFCNRSTAEMKNSKSPPKPASNDDVRIYEMRFSEGQMKVAEDSPQRSQSDLMKFSDSEHSDLMKFSTNRINSEDPVEAKNLLPSFSQLGIAVSQTFQTTESIEESSSSSSSSSIESSATSLDPQEPYLPALSQILPDGSQVLPAISQNLPENSEMLPAISQINPDSKDDKSLNPTSSGSFDSSVIPIVVKELMNN